ncbi:hypothetical protein GIB67_008759 [Kingdonia uniflora]|uniref:Pectinesterase n=1 Tax=Kingdonia uniflora TaxID=39325 RepID=A0A7J7P6E3_9MAGN|nr:hypothetical protein GIB67_008759 [Kingdonia uniflora]
MASDNDMVQERLEAVRVVHEAVVGASKWSRANMSTEWDQKMGPDNGGGGHSAWSDCVKLYEDSDYRLQRLVGLQPRHYSEHEHEDALSWLSAALTSHSTCVDGLKEKGHFVPESAGNLSDLLRRALALYSKKRYHKIRKMPRKPKTGLSQGLLAFWDSSTSKADYVVAQDGSGNYKTIKEVVSALAGRGGDQRVVIYVKSGVYQENVEIDRNIKNAMFVGDGIDKTIVTGYKSVQDGASTTSSATFGVSGDGFWARDMTFENTAGPEKHQAVALRVSSDFAAFYRCSFKGFQDTLFAHSLRQFYRDCHIYGTQDFIFGNAAAVFQNCYIFVRKPMGHQSNVITAQGREDKNQNTGTSIQGARIVPASEFEAEKGSFKSFLGRPWKKYSRTVIMKTDLDGMIDPKGWSEWSGNFALSTLFYAEYMNSGNGAATGNRVSWPGFHLFNNSSDVGSFTVSSFIQGDSWIPMTGVPFLSGI